MSMSAPPFYLVWHEDGRAPTFKHQSQHLAENEAKRLSRESPGIRFYVLTPVARVVTSNTVVERFDPSDEIPF